MKPHQIIFELLFLGSVAYAFVKGGRPERACAAIFVVAATTTLFVLPPLGMRYRRMEAGVLLIDFLMLVALIVLWKTSSRRWPILMVAFQIVDVMLHLARSLAPQTGLWAYQRAATFWSYPMLLLLIIATHRHMQLETGRISS